MTVGATAQRSARLRPMLEESWALLVLTHYSHAHHPFTFKGVTYHQYTSMDNVDKTWIRPYDSLNDGAEQWPKSRQTA